MDELKWGEEMEYCVGTLNNEEPCPKVVVEGYDKVQEAVKNIDQDVFQLHPEGASWMVEVIPKNPFTIYDVNSPVKALEHLAKTRKLINDKIRRQGMFMNSISSWPNLGAKGFFKTDKEELYEIQNYEEHNTITKSSYILDDMINSHPRYLTLVSYICGRAGKKIEIKYPLYKDINTGVGKIDGHISPDEIYMNHADFGIG
jgi:hypothetical protein